MLRALAQWWVAQMRALAPAYLLPARKLPDALLAVIDSMDENEALSGALLLRQDGLETQLQRLAADHDAALPALDTGLVLPASAILQREVVLPLAAAKSLHIVLGYEMDRLTPFAPEEVYWATAHAQMDAAREKLTLRLFVVLRAQVDHICAALARRNIVPSYIEIPGGRIELGKPRRRPAQFLQTGLIALCAILGMGCVAMPFWRQQMALDAAASVIAANTQAALVAQTLRQQLEEAAQGRAAVAKAQHSGDVLHVLAALTSALPDGTYLSDLTLKDGDLSFDGQSSNAAQLIALLAASPALRNPNFTAPVTRTADGKADQFSLDAKLAP